MTILQLPSFSIGNDTFWLLRWQYQPGAKFTITFNPLSLFLIAALIATVGVLLK